MLNTTKTGFVKQIPLIMRETVERRVIPSLKDIRTDLDCNQKIKRVK